MTEQTYLFEYGFDGDTYGLPVQAKSLEDARRKIGMMQYARYKGEVAAIIPMRSAGLAAVYPVALLAIVGAIFYALS